MKIVVVDDERLAVENMLGLLKMVEPQAECKGFCNTDEALDYIAENKIDIVFLDIELAKCSGIDFAQKCKLKSPEINIVFVTGYSQYTIDAFKLHVSGYMLKPVRMSDLRTEMDNLRHPIDIVSAKRVRIQTFGHFDIFVDDKPLKFTRIKCKECLAFLIDRRGARVSYANLSAILWEDRPFSRTVQNNTQKITSDLMKTLKEKGVEKIIIKSRQDIAIDVATVNCDYYEAIKKNQPEKYAFGGEYMSNYSWAEPTLGELMKMWR